MNYIFSRFQDKQNPDRQGYILSKNNKELEMNWNPKTRQSKKKSVLGF